MTRVVAVRLLIRGRVQGVGFRDAMLDCVTRTGVAGWVRNTVDGDVEAFVQGAPDAVQQVVTWCRRGPPLARVASVEAEAVTVDQELQRFDRRPTG